MTTIKDTPSEKTGTKRIEYFYCRRFAAVGFEHCAERGLIQCEYCEWKEKEKEKK